jgi:4-alpha-glucanotransferase
MNDDNPRVTLPPFPPDYRASGILLHVSSLPSRYGIGDLGPAAAAWIATTTPARQYTPAPTINPTTREWYDELPASQRQLLWRYLKRPEGRSNDPAPALIELAWASRAALAIVPLQDVLNLGAEARMNTPGRIEDNWCWRCPASLLPPPQVECLRELTRVSGRSGIVRSTQTTPA